jgi:peptidyl-prolyl cis-trans isomerase C
MRRRTLVALGLAAIGVTAIAAGAQIVAEVAGRQITVADVRTELRLRRATGSPEAVLKTMGEEGRAAVVDEMVARQTMAAAARRDGLDRDAEVAAEIDRTVSGILANEYERRGRLAADVSEPALRAYYDAHGAEFQTTPRVRARHILSPTREEAERVRAELDAGADFAAVAQARSADRFTRDKGGELGWIAAGTMVQAFEDALFALEAGQTSGVVQSPYGFHVIRIDSVEPAAVPAFDTVRDAVRERVRESSVRAMRARLKTEYPVTVYPEALKALER